MNPLAATEHAFQAGVLGQPADIDGQIAGEADLRRVRLGIYADAYRLRLTEVLSKDYEALAACLGGEAFDKLARDYLAAHPSRFRNVRWFGGALADFLAADPRYRDRPVLAELAQLEWAMGLAFDCADMTTLQFSDLAKVSPEIWPNLRFQFHPSVQLLSLQTNAVAIWHAAKDKTGEEIAPVHTPDATHYVVWRKDLASYFRSAPADEAWAIEAAREGQSFAEICAGMCDWVEEESAATRVAGYLRGWVDECWIQGIDPVPA